MIRTEEVKRLIKNIKEHTKDKVVIDIIEDFEETYSEELNITMIQRIGCKK